MGFFVCYMIADQFSTAFASARHLGMGPTSLSEFSKLVGGIEVATAELAAEYEANTDVPADFDNEQAAAATVNGFGPGKLCG